MYFNYLSYDGACDAIILKWSKIVSAKSSKYRGYLFAELIAALAVTGVLITCFAISLDGFRRFNHYQLVRQHCIAAAQAQLDSISKMGKPVGDEDFNGLWPKLAVSIQQSPGTEQWKGLQLVEVTVGGQSFNKQVQVKLSRYILEDKFLTEGKQ